FSATGGTVNYVFRARGNGGIAMPYYGDGAFTGAVTQYAAFDTDGNVIEALPVRTVAAGHPAESKSNSVSTDQDYTSIYTIPANYLTENKGIRVTLGFQYTTGTSTATVQTYIKVGSTKVIICGGNDLTNGVTRSGTMTFTIHGTDVAGGSANVESMLQGFQIYTAANQVNTVTQPQALATNGTLAITPGITYSATGGTESMVLRTFTVELLN